MQDLSNESLVAELRRLTERERELTHQILLHINEFERRKLHFELGFTSIIEWLIKDLGYSEGAAYRHLSAARLLRDVPTVGEIIQAGQVTLSSLASLQTAIRSEERRTLGTITPTQKHELVKKLEHKSKLETERIIAEAFPLAAKVAPQGLKVVSGCITSLTLHLDEAALANLNRVKEILSHAIPDGDWGKGVSRLAEEYLKKHDPLLRSANATSRKKSKSRHDPSNVGAPTAIPQAPTAAKAQCAGSREMANSHKIVYSGTKPRQHSQSRRWIATETWRAVMVRDQGQCQIRESKTGKACGSRWQIELDHVLPWSLGGKDTIENLRCVCRRHNLRRAEEMFSLDHRSHGAQTR